MLLFSAPKPIRGIDAISSTTLLVIPGLPLSYHWEGHGFKLHIPAGALNPTDPPLELTITASLSGSFQLPDNTHLMSGVYWIAFPKRFLNPVTVEVQHCALVEHSDQPITSLSFATAKCTQKELPYNFRFLKEGEFSSKSCYATIKMSHFSAVAVVSSKNQRKYVALTLYIPQATFTWLMHFMIIWDLQLYVKVT